MTFRPITDVPPLDRKGLFLVDGLVSSKLGLVYGEPYAGKSLLTVGMAAALVNGATEFLGRPVNRAIETVAFGVTDPGGEAETRARIESLVHDPSRVLVDRVADDSTPGYWDRIAQELAEKRVGLFVLDNVLGAAGPGVDVADSTHARAFLGGVQSILTAGVPVLLVTHSPKSIGEGKGWRPTPIGSTLFGAQARVNVLVSKRKDGFTRVITSEANGSEGVKITARCDIEGSTPKWVLVTDEADPDTGANAKRTREKSTWDARGVAVDALVEASRQGQDVGGVMKAARFLAEQGHGNKNTLKSWLGPKGCLGRQVQMRDGQWVRSVPPDAA